MTPIWSNADICLIMYDDVIESVLAQSTYTTESLATEGFILHVMDDKFKR